MLTGKYREGVPDDSRAALAGYGWLADRMREADTIERIERLRPIADRLGCTMAQLALAWCATNPAVSTVITGASRVEQVEQNFGTVEVIPAVDATVRAEIGAVFDA